MLSPNDPARSASAPGAHEAARVQLSLSEIDALCFKAARGAGLDWGEAEEAGWAAAWLSRAGLAGPTIILGWLNDLGALERPAPAPGRWAPGARAQCPLRTGIALADFAGLAEGPGEHPLTVVAVAHPRVTLPFLSRAARRLGLGLSIGWGGGRVLLDTAGRLSASAIPADDHPGGANMTIKAKAAPAPATATRDAALPLRPIALADWQALDALALRVTVPPSAQSRAGAGAAGDDND